MSGDFSGGGPNVSETVDEMATFFKEFRSFVAEELPPLAVTSSAVEAANTMGVVSSRALGSLLSVMFAINSGSVMEYATQPNGGWRRVLRELDVLAAFGFARLPHTATVSSSIAASSHKLSVLFAATPAHVISSDLSHLAAFILQAAQMQQLCVQSNCTFWVDMELFRADMSSGLLPKDFAGVAQELVRLKH